MLRSRQTTLLGRIPPNIKLLLDDILRGFGLLDLHRIKRGVLKVLISMEDDKQKVAKQRKTHPTQYNIFVVGFKTNAGLSAAIPSPSTF